MLLSIRKKNTTGRITARSTAALRMAPKCRSQYLSRSRLPPFPTSKRQAFHYRLLLGFRRGLERLVYLVTHWRVVDILPSEQSRGSEDLKAGVFLSGGGFVKPRLCYFLPHPIN